jgi:glycosyltransferase involved in cell wall biosynthesis
LVNGSGIDLEAFRPVALPDRLSFLMVARLLTEKGVREYVEAARCVRARHPEVAFRLAGGLDTAQRRRAIPKEEVQSWVAEGVIDYLGHVEDIREALSQASVFVLPSYYPEGQPRSILEALAMGRPVVTTDWNGCRETVEVGQNGFLVPPRDVASLVDTLQKFIEHPEQIAVMGRASRRLAEKKYNVHLVNRVIMETMDLA